MLFIVVTVLMLLFFRIFDIICKVGFVCSIGLCVVWVFVFKRKMLLLLCCILLFVVFISLRCFIGVIVFVGLFGLSVEIVLSVVIVIFVFFGIVIGLVLFIIGCF